MPPPEDDVCVVDLEVPTVTHTTSSLLVKTRWERLERVFGIRLPTSIKTRLRCLKEGPHKDRGSKTVREFVSKYNLPAYKGSGRGFENEQIEGRDPILEVEAIQDTRIR